MTFGATWFTHLLRPARLLAPQYGSDHLRGQRGLLLPGFQRVRPVAGYDCSSDWTPLLAGLSLRVSTDRQGTSGLGSSSLSIVVASTPYDRTMSAWVLAGIEAGQRLPPLERGSFRSRPNSKLSCKPTAMELFVTHHCRDIDF